MIAKRLEIQNFMGLKHGRLDFSDRGLVLIEGQNNASPTSTSNGACKSTIYDAVQWVLYGTTKRGVKNDEVVNGEAKRDCIVEFLFDDYKVVRTRKHKVLKNSLHFYSLDGTEWRDISRGTNKDTQSLINETIGMSELTFQKCAHFGQGDVQAFAALSDKQFKEVFEQALGLTFFTETLEKIKARLKDLYDEKAKLEHNYQREVREAEVLQEKIEDLREAERCHTEQVEERKRTIKEELTAANQRVQDILREISALGDPQAEYDEAISGLDERRASLQELAKKALKRQQDAQFNLAAVAADKRQIKATIDRDQKRLDKINDEIGNPCSSCGQPVSPEAKQDIREKIEKSLQSGRENMHTLCQHEARLQSETEKAKEMVAKVSEAIEVVDAERGKFGKLLSNTYLLQTLRREGVSASERVNHLTSRLKDVDTEENPHTAKIKNAGSALRLAEKEVAAMLGLISDLNAKIDLSGLLKDIFSNDGLKSHVFDSVTPALNKMIARNAAMLDDISIEVSTMTRLKSGEAREKFAINISNKHGADSYEGNSGGEKQKINIALALAFNGLVRSMSPSSLNFIFLDEVFESLDEGSSEPVVELCRNLAKEIPNTFIITHQEHIKDHVHSRLKVVKHGKYGEFDFS